jgi:hypothetical protein
MFGSGPTPEQIQVLIPALRWTAMIVVVLATFGQFPKG